MPVRKIAQRIMDLFEGSETMHGTHGEPELDENGVKWGIKRTARTLKGPATLALWNDHLSGKTPLGVIPIRNDSSCRWGSVDVDEYDVDAVAVVGRVEAAKLPLVPCRSKSGGLHLFMFTKEFVTAELMQGTLRQVAASLGFSGSEIFPKQTKILVEKGDQGNWMVMPYYGGDFGGKLRFQYGLKRTGAEMTPEEFASLAERRSLTGVQLEELRGKLLRAETGRRRKGKDGKSNGKQSHESDPFFNGPPCLQHMASGGFPEGGRNNALFHIGVFLRRAFPDDWQKKLEADNARFMKPPLPDDEVKSVIRSLEKRGYEYTCKVQPMEKHCDPVICRSRKHGVGAGGAYPTIEGLSKLMTEPPIWFVQIPGAKIMVDANDLGYYRKFHSACMNEASVCFKIISDKEWNIILGEAMKNVTELPAPPEIGRSGVFREMVYNFLTNRTVGDKKEDLLRNVPWEDADNKRFLFSIKSIEDYFTRERVQPRFTRHELSRRIRDDLGGEDIQIDIRERRNVRVWFVNSDRVERAPDLDPPTEEKEVI